VGIAEWNNTLYAIGNNSGLYFSQDKGDTWKLLKTNGSYFSFVTSLAISSASGRIYLGTDNGLYASNDQGKTFSKISIGISDTVTSVYVRRVDGTMKDMVVAGTYSGVSISKDDGVTFKANDQNIVGIISIFVSTDGTIYAGSAGSGLYISGDGIVWFQTTTTDGLPDGNVVAIYAENRKISD
jgi:photosystem II stability/assembly factor-like uncharacterized protein